MDKGGKHAQSDYITADMGYGAGCNERRKRSTKRGEPHIFAGLLKCPDCGNTLAKNSHMFCCLTYKLKGKERCTNHHVSMTSLSAVVSASIQSISMYIQQDKDYFIERISGKGENQKRQKLDAMRNELNRVSKRLAEIRGLVKKAFEQNTAGKLPDDMYDEMVNGYKAESEELTAKLDSLTAVIDEAAQTSAGVNEFVGLVEKYIGQNELDSAIVHELIEKIVVHQAQKIDGKREQDIDIYYRFVGIIE